MKKFFICIITATLAVIPLKAQFYSNGADPGFLKWNTSKSSNIKLVYPQGLDSLASVYGGLLERYRPVVGLSAGFTPGQLSGRIPLVLHSWSTVSNGVVAWAPMRMEFFTTPEPYSPEPIPWETELAIHESRHVAQMQLGHAGKMRWLNYLFGNLVPGAAAAIYPGMHLLEGDAVVAETALSGAGRGRSASFLEYYNWAFDHGDWRNWEKWRWGSWRHYAPNHYALGYMTIAGARTLYDRPFFMAEYFGNVLRRPLRIGNMRKTIRSYSGKKFNATFSDIMEYFHEDWKGTCLERGAFNPSAPAMPVPSWYTDYEDFFEDGGNMYATREGSADARAFVRLVPEDSSGFSGAERIRSFADGTSQMKYDPNTRKVYWSESVQDARWGLLQTSRIRYFDMAESDGKRPVAHDLTTEGRLFNPSPSPDGKVIAAADYPVSGGTAVVMLSASDGSVLMRFRAPDSLQVYETEWIGDDLYVAGISGGGAGIYRLRGFRGGDSSLEPVLGPQPVSIGNLGIEDDALTFVSDRTGAKETYSFDTASGTLRQMTTVKYGADNAFDGGDGNYYYTSESGNGHILYRTPVRQLTDKEVSFSDIHHYPIADKLSAQEAEIISGAGPFNSISGFSAPRKYRKALPRIHSWAPVYMEDDNVEDIDYNTVDLARAGVTVFGQNLIGTLYGSAAAGLQSAKGADGKTVWNPIGRMNLTYTGLWPAFEFKAAFGERDAVQYRRSIVRNKILAINSLSASKRRSESFDGSFRMYVPLNFSSGGIHRKITPSVRYRFTNDAYDKSVTCFDYADNISGGWKTDFAGYDEAENVFMQIVEASVSGYITRATASSQEYPSLGAGAEIGYRTRVDLADLFSSGIFVYGYGYLPGLTKVHGLRLSALWQHRFSEGVIFGENTVNTEPRGFSSSPLRRYLANNSPDQVRLQADYAIPVYAGDISWLSPLFYVTHFMLKPHADVTFISLGNGLSDGNLASFGADIEAHLAHFLWIPYDTSVGLTLDYNCGSLYNSFTSKGIDMGDRLFIGAIFSINI